MLAVRGPPDPIPTPGAAAMTRPTTRPGLALLLLAGVLAPAPQPAARAEPPTGGSPVATALWFAHAHAEPHALAPGKDRALKVKLITTVGTSRELSWAAAGDFFDQAVFRAAAGGGDSVPLAAMERLVREKAPRSRTDMNPKLRQHADLLTTQFDQIEAGHHKPGEELVAWVVKNYRPGKPLGVICMCTKNTRRSALSAAMGNVAAAYYGLTEVRFTSGGLDPDAINPRTVATLREAGVEVEPTGDEAPRGKAGLPNPVYRVRWGKGLEAREFSKAYTAAPNPREGFAAVLVCSEADDACPKVPGAAARIPVSFLDPKAFDGAAFEAAKYAERRDDIGRFMLSVMVQARRRLEVDGRLK